MAFQPGYKAALYIGTVSGALVNFSGVLTDVTVPQTVQTQETSVFGTVTKSFITGLTNGDQISANGIGDVTYRNYLLNTALAGSLVPWMWGPGGSVASQARSAGSCYVTSVSEQATVGGLYNLNVSLQVTGAVTNGTF